ncbi:MAG: hypothetical protein GYB31_08650 [Bacteroidetes bacterium]|nr:hypothetical protein [Bacteroidota bacterium]
MTLQLKTFLNALVTPVKSKFETAKKAKQAPDFVFNGLTSKDLNYDKSNYPVEGTYNKTTPAWLNEISLVPDDWQWSEYWAENNVLRNAQIEAQQKYMAKNVPGQSYSGSTAEIIQQWYTKGMWNPDPAEGDKRNPPLPIFDPEKIKRLTENWINDDAEFARQRLGGSNPNVIKLAKAAEYNIANWISKASNGSNLSNLQTTLTSAQKNNTLFVCDYTQVVGSAVTQQFVVNKRFLEAPICYFIVDSESKNLKPVAIQIKGTDPTSYIFTPEDSNDKDGDAWLLAKLWVANADAQWWFSGSHLMNCHSIVMLFGIAALNQIISGNLSEDHPMVILAKPFLTQVFSINNAVISAPGSEEKGIYQKDQFCDLVLPTGRVGLYQIINSLYEDYHFDNNAFPTQMSNRCLDSGAIGDVFFPYRDDGKVWWDAITSFVSNIVNATYTSDTDVTNDKGLMAWMNATQAAFNHDNKTRFNTPETKADLMAVFTNLLYTCSAKHTSVNDAMLPGWAFTANGPFVMTAAAPKDAASVSQETVLSSLPNPQTDAGFTIIQNQITFVMAGTAVVDEEETAGMSQESDEVMLKYHPYKDGSPQQQAVKDFWNAIWTGDGSVKARIMENQSVRINSWSGSSPVPYSLSYYYLSAFLSPCVGPEYLNSSTMTSIQI